MCSFIGFICLCFGWYNAAIFWAILAVGEELLEIKKVLKENK